MGLLARGLGSVALALAAGWAPGALAQSAAEELGAFVQALNRLREGDSAAEAQLLAIAEGLCTHHERCDALDVARFFAALSPAERARGLADEARFAALREEAVAAGREGLAPGESWRDLRADLIAELEALATEVESAPDFSPAARAHALAAHLELSAIEDDPSLDSAQRDELAASATDHVTQSLALFERCGMVTPRLEPLWIRGRLARAAGERQAARGDFARCLELAQRVGRDEYRARALLALVQLARDEGDLAQVDRLLAELARITSPEESWPLVREHAVSLLGADRPEAALAFLLSHPPEEQAYLDSWHALLAAVLVRSGDLAAARREVQRLEGNGEVGRLARAALALADGVPSEVLALLEEGAGLERWSPRARAEAQVLIGEARLQLGRPDLALSALEAALEEARRWSLHAEGEAGSVIGEWLGVHAVTLLARARAELGDPIAAAALIEERQTRRLREHNATIDATAVSAWARRFERGLVTWGVGADQTVVAWIGPRGEGEAVAIPLGRRELETAVRRLREAVIADDRERAAALAGEIGAELFPPAVAARLTAGAGDPSERLLLCVHGPLEMLPLSLVWLEGVPLGERLVPVILPGLPEEDVLGVRFEPETAWSLLGSPLDDGGAPALPGAARELAQLGRERPAAELLTGAAFRRGAFFEALASGRALHLATHLVEAPACGDRRLAPVGLALSAGEVVCAAEILEAGAPLPLVVLAACETAGGRFVDAEGVHGLARAFLEAGTRDLVVTLWPVEDGAAQVFALDLHAHLAGGKIPSRAVAAARRDLRAQGWPPSTWAAFRLLGRD